MRSSSLSTRFKKVLLTGLGTLVFLWASGQSLAPDPAYLRDFLRRVAAESGAPGVSAAVAVGGQLIFSDGIGYADLDNLIPQTGKTVHNIGSVSKAEAVVAILQLEEKGLLNLDDEIQKYLPYMPRKEKPITIRHLLTHTSGIRHYAAQDNEAFGTKRMRPYGTFEEATTLFREDPLLFEPGAYYLYSSFACNLMHGLVEKVSGLGFEEYMKRHVWLPAGMLTSSFDVPARVVPHRGKGYVRAANGLLINAPYEDVSYKYAGGGIISTAEDMVKLGVALNRGLLLKPATLKKMTTPYFNKYEKAFRGTSNPTQVPQWQGLIWFVGQDQRGRSWYGHSGTVKGTRCFLINFPTEGVVVAIQANIGSIAIDEYALALAQLVLAEAAPPTPSR